jgi:RNA ligase (TIGR02306 family)
MNEATVQIITSLVKHPNADALDIAQVLGWQCVTKLGEFKEGEKAVYIEIDSQTPEKPEFEFLRPRKFRVKTAKLREVLSQGLLLPLSILPEGEYEEGQDVSSLIGVTHYEKPLPGGNSACTGGRQKGNFPAYVPKTDEPRVQSYPRTLEELRGLEYYATVKLDGASGTFSYKDGDFNVCSRNFAYNAAKEGEKETVYWQAAKKYEIERILIDYGKNIAIQGEVVSIGLQKNRLNLEETDFFVFDIWDIDQQRYFTYQGIVKFCEYYSLKMVPVDRMGIFNYTLEEVLDMAEGYYEGTKNRREGLVIRPVNPVFSPTLRERLSVKAVNNMYLLKDEQY